MVEASKNRDNRQFQGINNDLGQALAGVEDNRGLATVGQNITADIKEGTKKLASGDRLISRSGNERLIIDVDKGTAVYLSNRGDLIQTERRGNVPVDELLKNEGLSFFRGDEKAAKIAADNAMKINSGEFKGVLYSESIGGNAGVGSAAVNGMIDREGRIVTFGNIQDIRPKVADVDGKLDRGELYQFSIKVKMADYSQQKETYKLSDVGTLYTGKQVPIVAAQRLLKSIEEANKNPTV
jgi:hypothetical protein